MLPENGHRPHLEIRETPLKSNLYIVRHGQTTANVIGDLQRDPPLTEQGFGELRNVGVLLREQLGVREPVAIIHTGLRRTEQTGIGIRESGNFGAELIIMSAFREREMGVYDGMAFSTFLERNSQMQPLYEQHGTSCVWFFDGNGSDGVEPLGEMRERVARGIEELHVRYADNPVIVVAHAGSVKMARMLYEGGNTDMAAHLSSYVPKNCEVYVLGKKRL